MPLVFDQKEFDREFDALDTDKKNCLNHEQFMTFVMNYADMWSEGKKNPNSDMSERLNYNYKVVERPDQVYNLVKALVWPRDVI